MGGEMFLAVQAGWRRQKEHYPPFDKVGHRKPSLFPPGPGPHNFLN